MSNCGYRNVRPGAAQRPDGKWVANAQVYWEVHGKMTEEEASWPERSFDTEEEARVYAKQAGEIWLDKKLVSKP